MANTAAKKAAPAKKQAKETPIPSIQQKLNEAREKIKLLQDSNTALTHNFAHIQEQLKAILSSRDEERENAKNFRDQYHALRGGYTEGIGDAYGVISNILNNLKPYEVPAVLGNLITELKHTNQAIRSNINKEILEREKEKDDYINIGDALTMALRGDTDFINLFTATQSIRHGQKNTYSQSTGENSKTFNGTPIMQTGAECIKDPSGRDFIVD